MGLLDEAIREHLELKRRRGADPAEIARAEKDALGPPARSPEPEAARAREERGEAEEAALDEPATAFAPGDDGPRAGREPRLRLADEPLERDEPRPPPEESDDRATGGRPAGESRLRVTAERLRERMSGAGTPPPPPVDDAPAVHDEPLAPAPPLADDESLAPVPPPADDDLPLDFVDDEPYTDDFAFADEEDDLFADEPGPAEPRGDEPLPTPPPYVSPQPPPTPREPQPPAESERYVPEPEPYGEPLADDPAAGPLDQPTQQYALEDVEDATRPPEPPPQPPAPPAGEEEEPEGEELLEETPEFLEETPEHDRLWFEQRPPRDFDF